MCIRDSNNAVVVLQGSDNGVTWTDLNAGVTYNTTNDSGVLFDLGTIRYEQFEVTQNQDAYKKYRLFAISGNSFASGFSTEVYFETDNFRSDAFPTATCDNDTDGDGIPNHQDLDSDGDGCYDLAESGAGSVTDSLVTQSGSYTDVGTNGLADHLETSTDSDTTDYASTYFMSLTQLLNACADSDGDGIGDLVDIDDDNDGILDVDELTCSLGTFAETSSSEVANNYNITGTIEQLSLIHI